MSYERPDRTRRVVETVERRWDDCADCMQEVVLDVRPMTDGEIADLDRQPLAWEVAQRDVRRHGDEATRLTGLAEGRRQEALDALEALEQTAQAGQTLILAGRNSGLAPETYTALAREIDQWRLRSREALLAAGQARSELLWTEHLRLRAREAYDAAVAREAGATP